jgi:hypothetical protein
LHELRGGNPPAEKIGQGQSRTQWTSLYHAEKHIPELHALLEAASRGSFDVLVVYDLNRFRDLMRQVYDALCDANVQLYILADPREPVIPSEYTEERKNEVGLTVGLRDIISRSEISNLQKHYRDKMPRRILDKGLHAGLGRPPYGFRKPPGKELDRNAVLIQDPAQVRILLQMRDWFFAGCSLTEIANRLNAQRIPSPRGRRWWYTVVAYVLANPFYAGTVSFGATKRIRNRRQGTIHRYKGTPVTAAGKHAPLWDPAVHHRILAELERRGQAHPGTRVRQLSRLLHCWCGAAMWAQVTPSGAYWRCSTGQQQHVRLRDDVALQLATDKIVRALRHVDRLQLPTSQDERPALRAELKVLTVRRRRWEDLYEIGSLDAPTLTARIAAIDQRTQEAEGQLRRIDQDLAASAATRSTLQSLAVAVETLPHYYRDGDKAHVNADLRAILHRILVHKDKTLSLEWR